MLRCLVLTESGFSGRAPDRFLLLARGEVRIKDEPPALMDDEAAALVLAAFHAQGHDMVIDYEHQTLLDIEAPAAGWVTGLEWDEAGLWALVRWTDKARGYIERGEYRYFSPVMRVHEDTGRVGRLYNIALTNQPRMSTIQALVAKHNLNNEEGGKPMLKKILKMLGLAEDASEDQVVAKLKETLEQAGTAKTKDEELAALKNGPGKDQAVACKELLDALGLPEGADKDKAVAAVAVLKEPAKASADLARRLAELEGQLGDLAAGNLVELALKEGKTSKAELDAWGATMARQTPEMFRAVVLSRQPGSVVPLEQVAVLKDAPKAGAATDEVQLSINKMLGVSEEAWKNHGPKAKEGNAR